MGPRRDALIVPPLIQHSSSCAPHLPVSVSTRGTINLFHASQARAAILGRPYVVPDDVKALVDSVLGHRIILRPNAEMQGASATRILHQLMDREHVPQTAFDA